MKRRGPTAENVVIAEATSRYLSPNDLAHRWRCSRSTVDRIVQRAGLTRLFLGEGRHGIVRYVREEVEGFEATRLVSSED